jgi:hypothetical protein
LFKIKKKSDHPPQIAAYSTLKSSNNTIQFIQS